jgi:imidazolonepropionase-like amidohydrolase
VHRDLHAAHAHARGVKVAMHALTAADARRAADLGADVLAHTPVTPLPDDVIAAWSKPGRAVISTLSAFGGSDATVANLRALRAHGATILYGTDLGNTRTPGINAEEITLLAAAGLDGAAIIDAATRAPAAYWHMDDDLGVIAPGHEASLLVLAADPRVDPSTLTTPLAVFIRGRSTGSRSNDRPRTARRAVRPAAARRSGARAPRAR